jgi:plastocyanin
MSIQLKGKSSIMTAAIFSLTILILSIAGTSFWLRSSEANAFTAAECSNLTIVDVTASGYADSQRTPQNAIDNNFNTRWSNDGKGSWLSVDLGAKKAICYVDIAWYKGDVRINSFIISVSNDGAAYTNVYSGKSSGKTNSFERYNFADVEARYVKVAVNGNQWNDWASITEIDVYGGATGTSTPPGSSLSINFANVAANQELSGTYKVVMSASDPSKVSNIKLYVDTTLIKQENYDPYEFNTDTTKFADGSHTLKAVATDTSGNTVTETVTVMFKNQASPSPPPTETLHQISFTQSGYSPSSVLVQVGDVIEWTNNGGTTLNVASGVHKGLDDNHGAVFESVDLAPGQKFSWVVSRPSIVDSKYSGQVPVHSHLGGLPDNGLIKYNPQPAGLYLNFKNLVPGQAISGSYTIEVIPNDPNKVLNIKAYLIQSATTTSIIKQENNPPYLFSLESTNFPDGMYAIKAVATDNSGNTDASEIIFNIWLKNGIAPPSPSPSPDPSPGPSPLPEGTLPSAKSTFDTEAFQAPDSVDTFVMYMANEFHEGPGQHKMLSPTNEFFVPKHLTIYKGTKISFHMADARWGAHHTYKIVIKNSSGQTVHTTETIGYPDVTKANSAPVELAPGTYTLDYISVGGGEKTPHLNGEKHTITVLEDAKQEGANLIVGGFYSVTEVVSDMTNGDGESRQGYLGYYQGVFPSKELTIDSFHSFVWYSCTEEGGNYSDQCITRPGEDGESWADNKTGHHTLIIWKSTNTLEQVWDALDDLTTANVYI